MRHRISAAAALLLGSALYVGGRPTSLRLFAWADAIGLGGAVLALREALAPIVDVLPDVVLWSVPFGLWVFAGTVLLRGTAWVAAPLLLAVAAELAQLVGLVPGVFDPVDLFVVVASGALGMLGRARSRTGHVRPAAITLGFAVLAAGTSETEEEKAERAKEEAENLAKLGEYTKTLQGVHDKIAALDLEAIEPKPCSSVKVELPKDAHGLRTVSHSFLARFGKDKAAWTKNEGGWAFMTDSTFSGHFEQHNDDRQAYGIQDTAERVQETFLPEKYLVVLAPVSADTAVLPKMHDKNFDGAEWIGWVFLADQGTGELACQVQIVVGSSDEIDFGGLLDSNDADKEMHEDFQDNFEEAINKVLPKGIEISSSYGSIVR
jgi:hypothetical protein